MAGLCAQCIFRCAVQGQNDIKFERQVWCSRGDGFRLRIVILSLAVRERAPAIGGHSPDPALFFRYGRPPFSRASESIKNRAQRKEGSFIHRDIA